MTDPPHPTAPRRHADLEGFLTECAAAGIGVVRDPDVTAAPHGLAVGVDLASRDTATIGGMVATNAGGLHVLRHGHLADGNLHVNVVGPAPEDDRAVEAVYALVLEHGGSVSAEHGVGVAKRGWLERQRGSAAVVAMRAIKTALDPDMILNPRVLLP